jgi:hypothetical protein
MPSGFEVNWTPPATAPELAVSYEVEWASDDIGTDAEICFTGNVLGKFDAADGLHTYFRVRGVGYDDSKSDWTAWTADTDPPPVPTGFSTVDGTDGGFLTVDLSTDTSADDASFRRWKVRIADDASGTNAADYGHMLVEEAPGKWIAQAAGTTKYYAIASEDWAGNVSTYTTWLPLVAYSQDYGPVEDSLNKYGGTEVKSGDDSLGLYWLLLDGFNAAVSYSDWTASEGSIYPAVTGRAEGASAACLGLLGAQRYNLQSQSIQDGFVEPFRRQPVVRGYGHPLPLDLQRVDRHLLGNG